MQSLYDQFNASALRISKSLLPQTGFQKFHLLTLDYRTPIVVSIIYVLMVSYFSKLNRSQKVPSTKDKKDKEGGRRMSSRGKKESSKESESSSSRFTPFKCLVIAHNIFLCLYSAITFLSVVPLVLKPYFSGSIHEAFCDVDKSTYLSGVNFWVWNFYVSKYYELLDTAILLIKGKPSSFLQTFHHSGSIVGMWLLTTTHAPAAWIFVLFNSFIHTVMYFYYTLTCFGFRPTWKKILTTMQIIQFLIGNPLGVLYAVLPGCFPTEIIPPENVLAKVLGSQARSLYVCLFVNTFFISSLVILFTDFSKKTYGAIKATAAVVTVTEKKSKSWKAVKVDEPKKSPKLTAAAVESKKSSKTVKAKDAEVVEVKVAKSSAKAAKKPVSKKSARSVSPVRSSAATRRSISPVRSTRPKRA